MKNCETETRTRRDFLWGSALLGGGAAGLLGDWSGEAHGAGVAEATEGSYALAHAENTLQTVCLQCNTGCGIRVRTEGGVVVKIDGSPYSPWTTIPPLAYKTPLADSTAVEGALCMGEP